MPTSTQDAVVAAIRELHQDVARIACLADSILGNVRGLYRRAKPGPVQPPIPGLVAPDDSKNDAPDGHVWTMPPPGEIARSLPRQWCNTVRVWEALWERYGDRACGTPVSELFEPATQEAIAKKTSRTILPQTVSRMLTALARAGAASRLPHNRRRWVFVEPTDTLREAVEREANRMNAHKAKEVSA